jgi:hypothetical protein
MSASIVVFAVLHLGTRMMACDDVPLLRLRQMKLAALGSGDHGEDPCPTCHAVSISLLVTTGFIGSKSILVCNGVLPDLGTVAGCLFSSATMVALENDGGRCFGEEQDSPRVEL